MFRYEFRTFSKIGSTQDECIQIARSQSFQNVKNYIILADEQLEGRGKKNNQWLSARGNFHCSIMLNYELLNRKISKSESDLLELVFVSAIALRETFAQILSNSFNKITLKWPNDVLVNGAKIAGILTEYIAGNIIIGIGANLIYSPVIDGRNIPVSNLKELGISINNMQFLTIFTDHFDKTLQIYLGYGFETIRDSWLKNSYYKIEQEVNLIGIKGKFQGIGKQGQIRINDQYYIST